MSDAETVNIDPTAMAVSGTWPSPIGLCMGLGAVLVCQVLAFIYYAIMRVYVRPPTIQTRELPTTTLLGDVISHVSAPESFTMVFGYLCLTWMFDIMPASYYDLETPVNWWNVLLQFLVVDFLTYLTHRIEHGIVSLYGKSHKPHHRFINPKLYNAFNGSPFDTLDLILIPLFGTAQLLRFCSNWDYIMFGSLYATQFTLIHCEFSHPWDPLLKCLGIGTSADHHIHHALFTKNYGHFFIYWDVLFGTYQNPSTCKFFRSFRLDEQVKVTQ